MPRRTADHLPDDADLDRADGRLVAAVDAALAAGAQRAGAHLACRPGCTECCIGPFAVNPLDARRLRYGLALLRTRHPERAAAIGERAARAVAALRDGFPGDPVSGVLWGDEEAEVAFLDRHADLPCPVLDPATGRCELYAHRPLTCRSYGPPVRIGDETLAPCRLCFLGADDATVAACRVEPDPDGLEDAVLDALERRLEAAGDAPIGDTLIAFAVAGG